MMRVRGLGAHGWMRALWLWWGLLSAGGLMLLIVAFFNTAMFQLRNQEALLGREVSALRDAFVPLRERQLALPLGLVQDFQSGKLTLDQLRGVRVAGEPFFKVYVVDAQDRPIFAGDHADAPPPWIRAKVGHIFFSVPGLVPIRRDLDRDVYKGMPENALAWFSRNPKGQLLICQTDVDYVFGPWLRAQLKANHLGEAKITVLTHAETWAQLKKPDVSFTGRSRIFGQDPLHSAWSFRVATFFPEDKHPFQQLRLDFDAYPHVNELTHNYELASLAFLFVVCSFAASLVVAGRSIDRELALATARANFTAMVSHELKTPVAAIRLYGEILVNKLVDDPVKIDGYHQTILDEAARLQRLIENLLDLGKIERGARTYETVAIAVTPLVEEAITQALAATPQGADYQLAREFSPSLPPLKADRDAARQAVSNIVHNALKYGGHPPDVTVRTHQAGNTAVVEVLDRGPGIPPAEHQAIFEPYVRLEDEARRESQGTGLGLALVKGYMEGQGGRVEVEARPGGGSIFRLVFPLAET